MARTKEGHQKICTGLLQVPTEQSSTPKEGQRTTPIENTPRTVAGNQHRHHQTFTKVKWNGYYSRHCRLVYEINSLESNNDEYFIKRNSEDL